jgi:hypothetical protein
MLVNVSMTCDKNLGGGGNLFVLEQRALYVTLSIGYHIHTKAYPILNMLLVS